MLNDIVGLLTSHMIRFTNLKSYSILKENVAPTVEDTSNGSPTEEDVHYREITEEEIQDIWKTVTLTQ